MILRACSRKPDKFFYFTFHDTFKNFRAKESTPKLLAQIQLEKSSGIRNILQDIVVRNILIIGLDRFSDYEADKSNIIVRDISSQTVSESISFLKDKGMIEKMMLYFKELLLRDLDLKNGWEPKQGCIYLMYRIIDKIVKLTPSFFGEFWKLIYSK